MYSKSQRSIRIFNFHPQNTAIEVCTERRLSFHRCTKVVVPGMVKLWPKGEAYKLLELIKTKYYTLASY